VNRSYLDFDDKFLFKLIIAGLNNGWNIYHIIENYDMQYIQLLLEVASEVAEEQKKDMGI